MQEIDSLITKTEATDHADKITSLKPYITLASQPGVGTILKRAIDLILGGMILIAALPLMAIIAVAVKANSPGPVLFVQRRVGQGGRIFKLYKFRSMIIGAEDIKKHCII